MLAGAEDLDVDHLSSTTEHLAQVVEIHPAFFGGRAAPAFRDPNPAKDQEEVVKRPWWQALCAIGPNEVDLDILLVGADTQAKSELGEGHAAAHLERWGEGSGLDRTVFRGRQIDDLPALGLHPELDDIAERKRLLGPHTDAPLADPGPVAAAEIPDGPDLSVPEDGGVFSGDAGISENHASAGRPSNEGARLGDEGTSGVLVLEGGHAGTVQLSDVNSCTMDAGHRRYRLLGRLGAGGFGVVYRARLEGPQGFAKDVAIKLLRDNEAPERVIARFRDEARILGLLRDRAIVGVDPPTRIDGQWALVMEYVDGVSCAELLRTGPLPASVAVEVIGEVARALHVAWNQPGPDGEPLQLLHRDLKPPNLQITPSGQVKVLDFGVARARFDDREAHTTRHLSGTPAYMAPERLQGIEHPSGDIYSLGVVLHELVTGSCPGVAGAADATFEIDTVVPSEPADRVVALARDMRGPHGTRPTAREVEERCSEIRADLVGPSLRDWAEEHVPAAPPAFEDERVGTVLTEAPDTNTAANRPPWINPLMVTTAAVFALALWYSFSHRPAPLHDALRQPFADLVMEHDAHLSERSSLRKPENWDAALFDSTVSHVDAFRGDLKAWRRIDQVWEVWRDVVVSVRAAGLPEVIAGIPWVESHYTPELQSSSCAKGLWQFMPETAFRAGPEYGTPLRVADCRFEDEPETLWSPTSPEVSRVYVRGGKCRIPKIRGCAVDERTDILKSTAATVAILRDPWEDGDFRASGAVVQFTVAAHNAGYGALARCAAGGDCDLTTKNRPGDYVAQVLAAHFSAICYYAQNYPEEPAFTRWRKYTDGYCRSIDVPTRAEVAQFE